jgi:hypothetical protein
MTTAMSNTALSNQAALSRHAHSGAAHRPTFDILVERVARSMLAWSNRRATQNQVGADRVALLLENQRESTRGGSSLGR